MYLALGPCRVTTPGTPVTLTIIAPAGPTGAQPFHAVMLQALVSNTGFIYIGNVGMNKSTLAKTGTMLDQYSNIPLHTFSAALTIAPNGLSYAEFAIDADQATDGVLVSLLRT